MASLIEKAVDELEGGKGDSLIVRLLMLRKWIFFISSFFVIFKSELSIVKNVDINIFEFDVKNIEEIISYLPFLILYLLLHYTLILISYFSFEYKVKRREYFERRINELDEGTLDRMADVVAEAAVPRIFLNRIQVINDTSVQAFQEPVKAKYLDEQLDTSASKKAIKESVISAITKDGSPTTFSNTYVISDYLRFFVPYILVFFVFRLW